MDLLARRLHSRPTLGETLEAVLVSAVELCVGVTAAGVNLLERRRFEPQAVLGSAPPELDALQQRLGDGPCIEASRRQTTVIIEDTASDVRWVEFGRRACELGVRGVVCVPLWVAEHQLGSLSLYAPQRGPFAPGLVELASSFATQAALAIAGAQRADNLEAAVDSRDQIGQAKGILMERYRITADEAFELLIMCSQSTRMKLHRVAERLTTTGELPMPPAAR